VKKVNIYLQKTQMMKEMTRRMKQKMLKKMKMSRNKSMRTIIMMKRKVLKR